MAAALPGLLPLAPDAEIKGRGPLRTESSRSGLRTEIVAPHIGLSGNPAGMPDHAAGLLEGGTYPHEPPVVVDEPDRRVRASGDTPERLRGRYGCQTCGLARCTELANGAHRTLNGVEVPLPNLIFDCEWQPGLNLAITWWSGRAGCLDQPADFTTICATRCHGRLLSPI